MPKPGEQTYFVPTPSRTTVFLRTFLPWQIVRFIWINFKMIAMIGKAHSHRALPPTTSASAGTGAGRLAASAAH